MTVRGKASTDDVLGDAGRNAHVLKPRIQSAVRTIDVLQVVARASSSGVSARDLSAELEAATAGDLSPHPHASVGQHASASRG